jgi:UDP-N-acetylmuramyl pentapeptide phosphotransferase/UDP-N-acetylglucosamine-1-phosphate transferase
LTSAWIGGGLSLVLSLALATLWRRRGWGDDPAGPERARKLQLATVPMVGGLAIGMAWCVQALLAGSEGGYALFPRGVFPTWRLQLHGEERLLAPSLAPWCAGLGLLVALASGWLDDRRQGGLAPLPKVALQLVAGLCLTLFLFEPGGAILEVRGDSSQAWETWRTWAGPFVPSLALALLAVMALNAVNTFDNADGAVCGIAGPGLLLASSPLAPAVLAFLVPNLLLRRRGSAGSGPGDPWAYLGDAGSQLLGMALVITPTAWPALLLPALDMTRVALLRMSLRRRPWVGDRRHLAHRLERLGLGPFAVVLVLLGISGPVLLCEPVWGALGTTALFVLACLATHRVREA